MAKIKSQKMTENQKVQIQLKEITTIIAILTTLIAIIVYTCKFVASGVKLNDLLYVSMYFQIAVFSGVLFLKTKNVWVKMFLVTNLISFGGFIVKYIYAWCYGSKLFISMMGFIEIGFIGGILFIIYYFLKRLWRY